MRAAVQLGLAMALVASFGFGQQRGLPLGNPLPPLSPIPPLGGSPRSLAPQIAPLPAPQRGLRSQALYSLPYYPAAYSLPAAPAPSVTIIQQFGAPPVPAAAEDQPAVTPQIREYQAPDAPPPGAEPAMFAIVLKDGQVLSATAVMAQGNTLKIVDQDGDHRRVPLDAIDRDATRRRNAERNLRLQLPTPAVP